MLKEIVRDRVLKDAIQHGVDIDLRTAGSFMYATFGFFIMEGAIVAEDVGLKYDNPL